MKEMRSVPLRTLVILALVLPCSTASFSANREKVVHYFSGIRSGDYPVGLISDQAGTLYGTAAGGATFCAAYRPCDCTYYGCGIIFSLTPNSSGLWRYSVIYTFRGSADGAYPIGLGFDSAGNLYGTTSAAGTAGYGGVFELTPGSGSEWIEKVLYDFAGGLGGAYPIGNLAFDQAGNLYGALIVGGSTGQGCGNSGCGMIYELMPNGSGGWTEQTIYAFNGYPSDGLEPSTGLILDSAGNVYGATSRGGSEDLGIVFELTPGSEGGWTEALLHSFGIGTDGCNPYGTMTLDQAGSLYGSTTLCGSHFNSGIVYRLTPDSDGTWQEHVLHRFPSFRGDGERPNGIVSDSSGRLYGSTAFGTTSFGTVFQLADDNGVWREKIIANFPHSERDGYFPNGALVQWGDNVFGLAQGGNTIGCDSEGCGVVFEATP